MPHWNKFFPVCLALLIIIMASPFLEAEETLRVKGDYLLFSDDHTYLFGSGKITLSHGKQHITGDLVYIDVMQLTGIVYGDVTVKTGGGKEAGEKYDAVFFKGIPPQWLKLRFRDEIITDGPTGLWNSFLIFQKKQPEELKNAAVYFEFREGRINKNKKIKARLVVPYMMGVPTVPLKKFTIHRGNWADKTLVAFKNVNYTDLDGLSMQFYLRMREKFATGDYRVKLYERDFFGLDAPKRGVIFSGSGSLLVNKNKFLNLNALLNSGDESFNLTLGHKKDFKFLSYSLTQKISGRQKRPTFFELSGSLTLKPVKYLTPTFSFSHDWKKSITYGVAVPVNLWKKMNLRFNWRRRLIKDTYRSDTSDFSTALGFNLPLFNISSNYNYSKNLVEASVRKNFSVNLKLNPLKFLEDNISIDLSTFYMFSAIPYGDGEQTRTTPGVNASIQSIGLQMPLGFELVPTFTFNHLWDNRDENFTDFNYSLALRQRFGDFSGSFAYSLASRYRAGDFWVEGSSTQNMNFDFEYNHRDEYRLLTRFYFNDKLALENVSFTGNIKLPLNFRLSSFVLYYTVEEKFRTLEVFVERVFKNRVKIQGGYSLALKRFFIKFLTL